MSRSTEYSLNIGFDCTDSEVAAGDWVDIIDDNEVGPTVGPASTARIGVVKGTQRYPGSAIDRVVVATRFRDYRKRTSGAACPVGPVVPGADNAVFPYTPASPAKHIGSATGPVTIVADTNDSVTITPEDGDAQTVQLTEGADTVFTAVAAELTAGLSGFTVTVNEEGNLVIESNEIGKSFAVTAVANDAYTLLGLTEGTYLPTNPSHDPNCVTGMACSAATAAGQEIDVLEW